MNWQEFGSGKRKKFLNIGNTNLRFYKVYVTYSSDDPDVATVSDTGLVIGVVAGNTVIYARYGNASANCQVTVTDNAGGDTPGEDTPELVTSISLDKTDLALKVFETYTLTSSVSPETAANKEVEWSTSNSEIASVDQSGLITALSKGTAIITATAKDGETTITVTGKGNYSGKDTPTFKILPVDISSDDVYAMDFYVKISQKSQKPIPELYYLGMKLKNKKDFTVEYSNASGGYLQAGEYSVTIPGTGNYTGTRVLELNAVEKIVKKTPVNISKAKVTGLLPFTIVPQDLSKMTLVSGDRTYKNKANIYKITPKLMDLNGKLLSAGKDFDKKSIRYNYVDDVVLENGIKIQAGGLVDDTDVIPAGTEIRVTIFNGSGHNYSGIFYGTYRIVQADISSAKATIPKQIYTGNEITLDKSQITVKLSGVILKPEDFEIVRYDNNIKKGTAYVTIKGVGNYGGIKKIKFSIGSKGFLWWWK